MGKKGRHQAKKKKEKKKKKKKRGGPISVPAIL